MPDQGLRQALPGVSDVVHPRDGGDLAAWAQAVAVAVAERRGSLTPGEVTAICRHTTGEGYRGMNGLLHGYVDSSPTDTTRFQTDIDNAISG
ncbi:MAG: hypothetical protein KJ792_12225 [Actinobacteria bacterium]|nr:hypothetical protein [Actinomycetota bacterium]